MEESRFHTGEKSAQKNTLLYACRLAECSRKNDKTAVSMVSVPYVRRFVNRRGGGAALIRGEIPVFKKAETAAFSTC